VVQASLGIKGDPISKITTAKKDGGMGQAVEHLLYKQEALSSNTSTPHPQCWDNELIENFPPPPRQTP
jgi:hypothetical protein